MKSAKPFGLLLISICISLVLAASTVAQENLVEDVEIRGYKSVSKEQILEKIKTRPGQRFNAEQVKEDLQRVMEIGVFDKLSCRVLADKGSRGGVVVVFILKELPKE